MEKSFSFHGRKRYKVDSKGRIPFPSEWFGSMNLRFDGSIIIARGFSPDEKFLELFSPAKWKEKMSSINDVFPEGKLKNSFIRWYVSTAETVSLDNQSRLRVPSELIEYAGLEKDAVYLGALNSVQLWSGKLLDETSDLKEEDFEDIFDIMNNMK